MKITIIAAAIAAAVGFGSAWSWQGSRCDADAQRLRADLAEERAARAERTIGLQKQYIETIETIRAIEAMQAIMDAKIDLQNQEFINATPANSEACFDSDALDRIFRVR